MGNNASSARGMGELSAFYRDTMSKKQSKPDTLCSAEAEGQTAQLPQTERSPRSAKEFPYELQMHEIELAMQNDGLRRAQGGIMESSGHYVDLYEFAPAGYLTLNRSGVIEEINLTGASLLGKERNKLIYYRFASLVVPEDRDAWREHFMRAIQHGEQQSCELALKRGNGEVFHARLDCRHIEAGSVSSVRVVFSDISWSKQTRGEPEAFMKRYQMLMKTSLDGIHILDIDGNLLEANDAFCHMLGYTKEEVAGLNVADWDAKWTAGELRSAFREIAGKSMMIETLHRRKDGTLLDVEISVASVKIDGRYCLFSSSRDVTERKRVESELLQTTRQLRELVAQCESLQEAERRSIAREVHDELGQLLSTLRLNISMIRIRFGKNDPELMWRIQNMAGLVDSAIHGARNVSENLHPAVMEMGIVAAIEWLRDNFSAHTGIPCVLDAPDQCVELEEARAVVIFRIVQESLTNVMRHAYARNVRVVISMCDDSLCVEVRDDGRGFDMNGSKQQASYGLLGMRERARACGGHLDVSSSAGNGTVVSIRIPVSTGVNK